MGPARSYGTREDVVARYDRKSIGVVYELSLIVSLPKCSYAGKFGCG
jgi:hypothetical protein